eukprot:jgi/Bigna1/131825/aug1.15_g6533
MSETRHKKSKNELKRIPGVLMLLVFNLNAGAMQMKTRKNHTARQQSFRGNSTTTPPVVSLSPDSFVQLDGEYTQNTDAPKPVYPSAPTERCRICEDVAQTWHDRYSCIGNHAKNDDYVLMAADKRGPSFRGCESPIFTCNHVFGRLRDNCFDMEKILIHKHYYRIWDRLNRGIPPMTACMELDYCSIDDTAPSPAGNFGSDRSMTPADEDARLSCLSAFEHPMCRKDARCPLFAQRCPELCYLCTQVVMNLPIFREACSPTKKEKKIITDEDKKNTGPTGSPTWFPYGARHELGKGKYPAIRQEQVAQNDNWDFLTIDDSPNAYIELNNTIDKKKPAAAVKENDFPVSDRKPCWSLYEKIIRSRKMRYFLSWQREIAEADNVVDRMWGTMWDANIACKCIGECEVLPFEDLALGNTCKYTSDEEEIMQYALSNWDVGGR